MNEHNPAKVHAAFETLLEEIEAEIDVVNQAGAKAFEERDYNSARSVLDRADQITSFRDKVVALRSEWGTLTGVHHSQVATTTVAVESSVANDGADKTTRASFGRLQRGLRTPEGAYYRPILKTLDHLGGRAKLNDILDRVKELMQGTLTEHDYQPLNSDSEMPRWRNAAQWARNAMVKEGLLKDDSPRGVWEISEAGRRVLAER
jgi:restriction system protein